MHFPRIIAAQRLQTWLLVTALVAVLLTGLLAADLARNLRSVVISETNKTLTNAVAELVQSSRTWKSSGKTSGSDNVDGELRRVSYEVLRSYPDIEGGSSGMTRLWDTAFQLTPSRKALFASLH